MISHQYIPTKMKTRPCSRLRPICIVTREKISTMMRQGQESRHYLRGKHYSTEEGMKIFIDSFSQDIRDYHRNPKKITVEAQIGFPTPRLCRHRGHRRHRFRSIMKALKYRHQCLPSNATAKMVTTRRNLMRKTTRKRSIKKLTNLRDRRLNNNKISSSNNKSSSNTGQTLQDMPQFRRHHSWYAALMAQCTPLMHTQDSYVGCLHRVLRWWPRLQLLITKMSQ
mmetsp:Transcript_30246/g.62951  ORF Transcript_30246/g.62951 Transcript_30246/m.62951 type:complete len:224 (+) Transcript_30246:489-1160(+)